jgi:hypothetical protein
MPMWIDGKSSKSHAGFDERAINVQIDSAEHE